MLGWVVTFLVVALIAGILGFGGVAGASSCKRPAKKPLSQVRCSGVNGADSGRISRIGGRGVDWFSPPPRARTWR